jgi:hypothetical protein
MLVNEREPPPPSNVYLNVYDRQPYAVLVRNHCFKKSTAAEKDVRQKASLF